MDFHLRQTPPVYAVLLAKLGVLFKLFPGGRGWQHLFNAQSKCACSRWDAPPKSGRKHPCNAARLRIFVSLVRLVISVSTRSIISFQVWSTKRHFVRSINNCIGKFDLPGWLSPPPIQTANSPAMRRSPLLIRLSFFINQPLQSFTGIFFRTRKRFRQLLFTAQ